MFLGMFGVNGSVFVCVVGYVCGSHKRVAMCNAEHVGVLLILYMFFLHSKYIYI